MVLPRGVDEQDDLGRLRLGGQRHRRRQRRGLLRLRLLLRRGLLGRRRVLVGLVGLVLVVDRRRRLLLVLRGPGLVGGLGVGGRSSRSRRRSRGGGVLVRL